MPSQSPIGLVRKLKRWPTSATKSFGISHFASIPLDVSVRQIFSGKDGKDTGGGESRGGVDRANAGMRMRRAQHEGMRLTRPVDVIDVAAMTGDEPPVLDAADRLTDAELLHGA